MPRLQAKPRETSSNLQLLRLVGETTFGSFWQKRMGAHLNVSQRHMVRWANGQWTIPDQLPDGRLLVAVLYELLEDHQETVNSIRRKLVDALYRIQP